MWRYNHPSNNGSSSYLALCYFFAQVILGLAQYHSIIKGYTFIKIKMIRDKSKHLSSIGCSTKNVTNIISGQQNEQTQLVCIM